jgi:DNA-nicking Smr family endonuclease
MSRRLTSDERELWDRLRRSVRPLRGSAEILAEKAESSSPSELVEGGPASASERRKPQTPRAAPPIQPEPPLAPLEPKLLRRLSRGLAEVDARIDLHGMRQERAFAALAGFLRHAQARGAKVVLVVTGKGRAGEEGRGVLRQSVPAWLGRPDFRDLVVGYEEAGRRHGGAGALYVRLRRRQMRGAPADRA